VKVETSGGNKLSEPVLEMLSEPKPALAIYFHRRFRLSQPAGDVGSIVLNGKKLNPTHLAHPEMLSEPKPVMTLTNRYAQNKHNDRSEVTEGLSGRRGARTGSSRTRRERGVEIGEGND
jgi:hypothetical protein